MTYAGTSLGRLKVPAKGHEPKCPATLPWTKVHVETTRRGNAKIYPKEETALFPILW